MKQQTGFIWRSLVLAIGLVVTPTSAMAQQAPPPAFQRCSACHAVTANAPAGVGPNLHGVFGRRAGSGAGFDYSDALRRSGVVWARPTLQRYLQDPSQAAPGTTMPPVAMTEAEREAIISYLAQLH